jgi:hypothetical protein
VTDPHTTETVREPPKESFAGDRFTGLCMIAAPLLLTTGTALPAQSRQSGPRRR